MNRLSKEKRSQIVLVIVMIAIVITGLYMGLIRNQQRTLENVAVEKQKATRKMDQIVETSRNSTKIDVDLAQLRKQLELRENNMVSDDLYASGINLLRDFKSEYPVEIKQFISKGLAENSAFAKFPYKQFTVAILGAGHYHDIGRFVADFENRFQSARVLNLELTPTSAASPDEKEQLIFKMDIVLLVKSTGIPPTKKP
jgi:Tfp pilus assembly protein PilO